MTKPKDQKTIEERVYEFWSIYDPSAPGGGGWLCIPPSEEYLPRDYPKNAICRKHKEAILPPPSYWLFPDYERIVYEKYCSTRKIRRRCKKLGLEA